MMVSIIARLRSYRDHELIFQAARLNFVWYNFNEHGVQAGCSLNPKNQPVLMLMYPWP